MKNIYQEPSIQRISIASEDVLTASNAATKRRRHLLAPRQQKVPLFAKARSLSTVKSPTVPIAWGFL